MCTWLIHSVCASVPSPVEQEWHQSPPHSYEVYQHAQDSIWSTRGAQQHLVPIFIPLVVIFMIRSRDPDSVLTMEPSPQLLSQTRHPDLFWLPYGDSSCISIPVSKGSVWGSPELLCQQMCTLGLQRQRQMLLCICDLRTAYQCLLPV
jgi:hypothetical protein